MSNRSKLEFVKSIHRFAFLLFFDNVWSDSSFGVDSENSKRLIEALALHCRFSCAVSHLSGTIHTVDQMCPDLFTPWGWNVYFRHFNREQEEYRTREKKSYKNFWTKGKLKRLRQRWGSIFAYAPLCSLCQCTCNIIFQIFCPRGFSDVRGNYNQTKLCAWKQVWGKDEGGLSSSSPLCSLCQCSRPRWMWVSPYHNLKLNDSQIGRDHLIKIFNKSKAST